MARHRVTHVFLAPTAIKRLAQTPDPHHTTISACASSARGEALAAETLQWVERRLGAVCNEFYGMTEVNHLIGNCAALFPRKPGSMGRAYPGTMSGWSMPTARTCPTVMRVKCHPDASPTRFLTTIRTRKPPK